MKIEAIATSAQLDQTKAVFELASSVFRDGRSALLAVGLAHRFGHEPIMKALRLEEARARGGWGSFGKLHDRLQASQAPPGRPRPPERPSRRRRSKGCHRGF